MAEIIKFVRHSDGARAVRDQMATSTAPTSNDRVRLLIAHERYWEVLAAVARHNGHLDKVQHFEMRAEALFDEIARTKANTIEGVIDQLRFLFHASPDWVEVIAASLQEIVASLRRQNSGQQGA